MAVIAVAEVDHPFKANGVRVFKWASLTETNNTGEPIPAAYLADKSVHVRGTWGTGGHAAIQGSNEADVAPASANYTILADPQGNSIDLTADKIEQILENPYWIRPAITAGTGVNLTVWLVAKR
jgi:hypothetical protein